MPPPLNLQTVVAFIWDFDKTLTPGYMQDPLFQEYGVDGTKFWAEVNRLAGLYEQRGLRVSADTAYLGHILSYVKSGIFEGLTNEKLRELGSRVPLAPGMPDFMQRAKAFVASDERCVKHGVTVEHYIVSTGLRQMIEGSPIRPHVDDVWACELISDPPTSGYLENDNSVVTSGILSQVGYALDNTTKTRAIFEINKGVNKNRQLDVNARMSSEQRRVPTENMIYIADGPSDVPVFSIVNLKGGKTLGVYTGGVEGNYDGVRKLEDDGRVNSIAKADYSPDTPADLWLMSSLKQIAYEICDKRERQFGNITAPAGHKV